MSKFIEMHFLLNWHTQNKNIFFICPYLNSFDTPYWTRLILFNFTNPQGTYDWEWHKPVYSVFFWNSWFNYVFFCKIIQNVKTLNWNSTFLEVNSKQYINPGHSLLGTLHWKLVCTIHSHTVPLLLSQISKVSQSQSTFWIP